jgi:hypothetical protein
MCGRLFRSAAAPLLEPLIVAQAHALILDPSEHLIEQLRVLRSARHRQGRHRLTQEAVGYWARVSPPIALQPPIHDPVVRTGQRLGRDQTIALQPLVHMATGGKQVPEIAARLGYPGKAVIDIEGPLIQAPA